MLSMKILCFTVRVTIGLNRKTKSEKKFKFVESSWRRRRLKHCTVSSSLSRGIVVIVCATTACPVVRRAERAITGGER